MEYILILALSFVLLFIACIGSILPLLPGTALSLVGVVLYKLSSFATFGWNTVLVMSGFVCFAILADYFIPIYGVKKMGGTKHGINGSIIGLIIGVALSPFGGFSILICPFLGAFLGELLGNNNKSNALKAAFGSFLGFLFSTGISFAIALTILMYCIIDVFQSNAF